jgi:hypothetical protein
LIRAFDGGEVSHAALYLGSDVAEAVGEGLLRRSLLASRGDDQRDYILAYRWKGDVAAADLALVVEHAQSFLARRPPYAHAEVMLAAVLALTRKIPLSRTARFLVRAMLDRAAKLLLSLAAPDRPLALMCSQFVFTCYLDTPPPLAPLAIAEASTSDAADAGLESSGVPLPSAPRRSGPGIAGGSLLDRVGRRWDAGLEGNEAPSLGEPLDVSDAELERQLTIFEGELALESGENLASADDPLADEELVQSMRRLAAVVLPPAGSGRESAGAADEVPPAVPPLARFLAVIPSFVTPGDLSTSPSLRPLGRIRL